MEKNIKDEIAELLKKPGTTTADEIAEQLQKINDLFLRKYKLELDDIEIIPLETEIYYHNEKQQFEDKMIHKNEDLQKKHFGKFYFHRHLKKNQNNKGNNINLFLGGVDICLSDGEYFLSILLRSIIFIEKNKEEFITGINKIQQKFYSKEDIPSHLRKLEEKEISIIQRNQDEIIDKNHILHQKRILNGKHKKGENYELNSIVINNESIKKYKNFYSALVQLVKPEKDKN